MAAPLQLVQIYGNGYDTQWVEIEGCYDQSKAKRRAAALYPGATIGGTRQIGYRQPEVVTYTSNNDSYEDTYTDDDYSASSSSSSTISNDNDYESSSSSSESSGGGLTGLVISGAFIGLLLLVNGGSESTDNVPDLTSTPAPVEYVQPTSFTQPTYTKTESNGCKIWADANPTLAAKLTSRDRCFGQF